MASNKKPRKKPQAQRNKSLSGSDKGLTIDNLGMFYIQGFGSVVTYDVRTGRLVPTVSHKLSNTIYHEMHKWNVLMVCLCRGSAIPGFTGEYFTQAHLTVSEPVLFDDLGYTLADYHLRLRNLCTEEEFKRMAWIAVPRDVEFNEDSAYKFFKRFQGFSDKMYGLLS